MTMQWYTHPPPTITEFPSTRTICPPPPTHVISLTV